MKSWHVTVLKNHFKQVEMITCISAKDATEKLAAVKEKYKDVPPVPGHENPEIAKGITYSFFREYF